MDFCNHYGDAERRWWSLLLSLFRWSKKKGFPSELMFVYQCSESEREKKKPTKMITCMGISSRFCTFMVKHHLNEWMNKMNEAAHWIQIINIFILCNDNNNVNGFLRCPFFRSCLSRLGEEKMMIIWNFWQLKCKMHTANDANDKWALSNWINFQPYQKLLKRTIFFLCVEEIANRETMTHNEGKQRDERAPWMIIATHISIYIYLFQMQ